MMKRTIPIIAFTLVLVMMALTLAACGDKVPAGNYYTDTAGGKWQGAVIQVQEDGSATLIIHEDGAMKVSGVTLKDGKLTGGQFDCSYTCKDGLLVLKTDDGDVIFKAE